MDVLKEKINECYLYLFFSIILAIGLPKMFNTFWLCLLGIGCGSIIGWKLYTLFKIKKNENYFSVETICTGKNKDYMNLGMAKQYEFEPLENTEFKDVIYLQLYNDETGSFLNRKKKVKEDCGYTLVFKIPKNGKKITNQANFIGYKRYVLPE